MYQIERLLNTAKHNETWILSIIRGVFCVWTLLNHKLGHHCLDTFSGPSSVAAMSLPQLMLGSFQLDREQIWHILVGTQNYLFTTSYKLSFIIGRHVCPCLYMYKCSMIYGLQSNLVWNKAVLYLFTMKNMFPCISIPHSIEVRLFIGVVYKNICSHIRSLQSMTRYMMDILSNVIFSSHGIKQISRCAVQS